MSPSTAPHLHPTEAVAQAHGVNPDAGLHADEADDLRAKAARTQARAAQGVPAPHLDDDEITRNLFFGLLPKDVQDAIRAEPDPLARRRLFQAACQAALVDDVTDG